MVYQRNTRQHRRQPADHCRTGGVGMDQAVALAADDAGQSPDGREVEAALHRHLVKGRIGAFSHGGELTVFEAGKSGPVAEVAQMLAQQVLHAFGPGVVLAVDDMQDRRRGNRGEGTRPADRGRYGEELLQHRDALK